MYSMERTQRARISSHSAGSFSNSAYARCSDTFTCSVIAQSLEVYVELFVRLFHAAHQAQQSERVDVPHRKSFA